MQNGWPFGEVSDTDAVYEKEKRIEPGHPVRDASAFHSNAFDESLY